MATKLSWKSVFKSNSAVSFCSSCGTILDFPIGSSESIVCSLCGQIFRVAEFLNKPIITRKVTKDVEEEGVEKRTKATINEHCISCNFDTLYFWTMQTRSADEGQTVFYECQKCGHKWSVNT